ncbi:hypothetical protein [Nonomuraea insulae]|uniref:Uncharacterized protein n=1 Tax=Nonomuraea insulae TaxID=1616787 RepID=A0ABW1D4T7_9ACTN
MIDSIELITLAMARPGLGNSAEPPALKDASAPPHEQSPGGLEL